MGCLSSKDLKIDELHRSINIVDTRPKIITDLKMVLTGPHDAGKTQFFKTYINDPNDPFSEADLNTNYDKFRKNVHQFSFNLKSTKIRLSLWDLAGHRTDSILNMTKNYFRDINGLFLIFDASSEDSFEEVKNDWLPFINNVVTISQVKSKSKLFDNI